MTNDISHTLAIPDYRPLFLEWLQTQHPAVTLRGGHALAQRFDEWFQPHWALLHFLGLTAQMHWVQLFHFWFVTSHAGDPKGMHHTSSSVRSPPSRVKDPDTTPTGPSQAPPAAPARVSTSFLARTSTRTVEQIQEACTNAGGEADAIARLAVVFPPRSVISRDTLRVDRKPKGNHCGYREFTRLLDSGRWYCRFAGSRTVLPGKARKTSSAIRGMVTAIPDPASAVISPEYTNISRILRTFSKLLL
jgi:hypothetical protein